MKRQILIITVIAAAVMELIDTSIVNVALSYMSGNLGATLEDTSWVITAYAIANVIIIPITSFLAAKLGRRNYYIGSVILFTLSSFLCGQATNIWMLVACRFMQGMGGGALLSVSAAIVYEQFPKGKQNIASALFGVGIFVGPTIGPTLGGYITEHFSWPWIFYINIPIGLIVVVICSSLLGEAPIRAATGKIDWTGILLLAIGVGSLQIVLERGQTDDWFSANYIIVLTVVAAFCLSFFIGWELKVQHPVVNLRVLKSRNLSVAALLTFVSGIGLFSSIYLTPIYAQRFLNFTPTGTGLLLLPGAILAIGGLLISARLLQRGLPPVIMITSGMFLFMLFTWQMSRLDLDAGPDNMYIPLIFRAIGLAIVTVPLSTLAVSSLEAKDIPQGTALNNMMRQLGGSFGIATVNTYLAHRNAVHRTDLVSHLSAGDPGVIQRLSGYTRFFADKGATGFDAERQALGLLDAGVFRQSNALSFGDAYLLLGVVFFIGLPFLLLTSIRKGKKPAIALADH